MGLNRFNLLNSYHFKMNQDYLQRLANIYNNSHDVTFVAQDPPG